MKRLQIQLDEATYEALRRRAFQRRRSLSATIRDLLAEQLAGRRERRKLTLKDFPWISSFSRKDPYPVSEEHDRALSELDEW